MKHIFDLRIDGEESGGPLGGTAPYKVILFEKCTVREFVEYVLYTENEWGYIGIYNPKKDHFLAIQILSILMASSKQDQSLKILENF